MRPKDYLPIQFQEREYTFGAGNILGQEHTAPGTQQRTLTAYACMQNQSPKWQKLTTTHPFATARATRGNDLRLISAWTRSANRATTTACHRLYLPRRRYVRYLPPSKGRHGQVVGLTSKVCLFYHWRGTTFPAHAEKFLPPIIHAHFIFLVLVSFLLVKTGFNNSINIFFKAS